MSTLTVRPHAFSYAIGNDSQTYGSPANLAGDLPGTIGTGVNGQTLNTRAMMVSGGYFPALAIKPELGRLIASSDVLLLQEAGVAKELRGTIERGGLSWVLASAFEHSGAEYGVLTATRVHPASVCTLRAYEPLLGIPKAALITQFRLEGRDTTLAVANLHSINFAPGTGEYRAQLDAIADALAAHRGPIVFAGDFNVWNDLA